MLHKRIEGTHSEQLGGSTSPIPNDTILLCLHLDLQNKQCNVIFVVNEGNLFLRAVQEYAKMWHFQRYYYFMCGVCL